MQRQLEQIAITIILVAVVVTLPTVTRLTAIFFFRADSMSDSARRRLFHIILALALLIAFGPGVFWEIMCREPYLNPGLLGLLYGPIAFAVPIIGITGIAGLAGGGLCWLLLPAERKELGGKEALWVGLIVGITTLLPLLALAGWFGVGMMQTG